MQLTSPHIQVMMAIKAISSVANIGGGGAIDIGPAWNLAPAIGSGAGSVDGVAVGQVTVTGGAAALLDLSSMSGLSGFELYGKASAAAHLIAMGVHYDSIDPTDVESTAILTVGGAGSNSILAATAPGLNLSDIMFWAKTKLGGLTIDSTHKNLQISGPGSLVSAKATVVLWTRSA